MEIETTSRRARRAARRAAVVFLVVSVVAFMCFAVVLLTFSPVEAAAALTPSTIRGAYNVNVVLQSGYTGRGVTVAVVNKGIDSSFYSDAEAFNTMYGLPDAVISIVRPYGSAGTDQEVPEGETTFDVELLHAMAPDARILLVLVGTHSLLDGFTYVIDNNAADVALLCPSWAYWGEGARELVQSYNAKFSKSVEKRITLIAASNVWGSNNTVPWGTVVGDFWAVHLPDSYLMPQYSPYVTAVGGTVLSVRSGSYVSEVGWDRSGGGPSNLFAQPTWQTGLGVPSNGFRNIPDIALNAACETAYASYWNGTSATFCGTSAAAAVFAGIIADIVQAAGGRLGFLNSALYSIASSDPSVFHDVTSGCSLVKVDSNVRDGYCASKGWDFVTGWGSPDAARLTIRLAPNATIIPELLSEKPEVIPAATAGIAFTSATLLTSQAAEKAAVSGKSWWDWLDRLLRARERAEAPVSHVEKESDIKRRTQRREVFHLAASILIVGSLLSFMGVKFGLPGKSVFDIFRYIKVLETMPTIEYVVKTPSFLVQAIASASIVLLMGYVARLLVARYFGVVVEYKSWILGILMLTASTVLFKSPYGAPSEVRTPKTTPHHIRGKLSLSFILVAIATSGILYVLYLFLGSAGWLGMGIYYGLALAASSSVPQKPLPGYAIYQYNKMLSIGLSITCFVLLFLYLDPITGPIVGVILAVASIAIAEFTRHRQPKGKPTIVEA